MKPVDSPPSPEDTDDLAAEPLLDSDPDDCDPDDSSESASQSTVLGPAMNKALAQLAEGVPGRTTLLLVLSELMELIDSERIFLFRLRKGGGFHVLAACNRDREPLHAPERRMSHYAVKVAMSTEKRLFIPDARHDRRYRAEEVLDGKKSALSILVLPLRVGGEIHGGVYADHRFHKLRQGASSGGGALRAWISIAQLVLGLREQKRDLRRRRRQTGERPNELAADSTSSVVDAGPARSSRASELRKWIEDKPEVRNFHGFLSANPDLKDTFDALDRLTAADLPVLIYGETGTGKSLLARAIHDSSRRRAESFLSVNHGSIPDSLFESELLGHVKGAFSGADSDREGVLVQADRGTLFFDGVGDMGADIQTKLLRVLEDGIVRPIGAKKFVKVDIRVISATRHRLESRVEEGLFRRDLYFRLKGVVFEIPPLRDRREDILPLCRWCLSQHARKVDSTNPPDLTRDACLRLVEYPWPGNVRELENEMRRLVALGVETVRRHDLASNIARRTRSVIDGALPTLEEAVNHAERKIVEKALLRTGGNRSQAAQALNVTRKSLYRRMKKYGLS